MIKFRKLDLLVLVYPVAALLLVLIHSAFAQVQTQNASPIFTDVTVNGTLTINSAIYGRTRLTGGSPIAASCGVSPTVTGSDNSFTVTMGSGTLTACSINFSGPWSTAPHCVASASNTTAAAVAAFYISPPSTTQIVFHATSLTSAAYQVICL